MEGRLYDGLTAYPHQVAVRVEAGALHLSQPDGWEDLVPASVLRRTDGGSGELRLGRSDQSGWRLSLDASAAPEIDHLLDKPERYGRWIDRVGLVPAILIGALVTAVVVATGYLAPHWIAPHVPLSWERNVGAALVGDFGDWRCRNPAGQRALDRLVERLDPGSAHGPVPIRIAALDVKIFNAAALPGGYIVVFKSAIDETEPDALAGLVAHEIAHVKRRHVTEALIRELGIGTLIRLFAGDLGANAQQIVALNYTRANEAEADSDAIKMLKRAGISPRPTAELFHDLSEDMHEGSGFAAEFLSSHPLSANRADKFAKAFDRRAIYRPALPGEDDRALATICGG